MSAWSQQRKLFIILTITVIVVFIISGVLFNIFYNPPSCNDGVQNGLEEGVDCGGRCADPCPVAPEPLRDIWSRAFPITNGVYAAVAYIENQNKTLYVPEVQFEFEIYDDANTLIGRVSQLTPVMPNGITPVFIPHIVTGEQKATITSFRFVREPQFIEQPYPYGFEIKDIYRETDADKSPYVRATAVNVGKSMVREVDFVIVLFDEEGTAVAVSRTFEKDVYPNEERVIQFSWVHPLALRKGKCPGGLCVKQVERIEITPIIRAW